MPRQLFFLFVLTLSTVHCGSDASDSSTAQPGPTETSTPSTEDQSTPETNPTEAILEVGVYDSQGYTTLQSKPELPIIPGFQGPVFMVNPTIRMQGLEPGCHIILELRLGEGKLIAQVENEFLFVKNPIESWYEQFDVMAIIDETVVNIDDLPGQMAQLIIKVRDGNGGSLSVNMAVTMVPAS